MGRATLALVALVILVACFAPATSQSCFQNTKYAMINPTTDVTTSNIVCLVGQPCNITWSAASKCDLITFDLGVYHWFQPATVMDDGIHQTNVANFATGVKCSSKLTKTMYPAMSTCVYSWIPSADPTSMTSGFLTLVISVNYGSGTNTRTDQMYGYLAVAATIPRFGAPAAFVSTFMPVLNGQLMITSSTSSVKRILEEIWGGASNYETPESWLAGDNRTVAFQFGYPILTTPIRADFFDLDTFFSYIRNANGTSIMDLMAKMTPAAVINPGYQFPVDPASHPDWVDNPDQQAPPSNGSFAFAVPRMLPGINQYFLALRAIDPNTPSAAMLRVEATTPVAPSGNMIQYAPPGMGYSGLTDATPVNFSSAAYECLKSSAAYPLTLNFTAGPAPSTIVTLSVGSALNFSCMLNTFSSGVVACIADDVAGETVRGTAVTHDPVCLRAQFLDQWQYALRLTFTSAEGSCAAAAAAAQQPSCGAAPPRRPALLRDQSAVGRMRREDPVASTFTAAATLIRMGATPPPTPTPSPTPSPSALPTATPGPTPKPSMIKRMESLPGPSIFGIVLCVLFGVGWVGAGIYQFYMKYFKNPLDRSGVLPK